MKVGRAPVIAGIVGVAVCALVVLFAVSPGGETAGSSPILGKLAPELIGTTLEGETFDIDDHRGRWVLVNFFATWCAPCVTEHPELVEFSEQRAGEVQVVSVVFNEPVEKVQAFFDERGGDWPVLTENRAASIAYGVKKLPESFLVNPDGTVVVKINGGVTVKDLDELIAEQAAGGPTTSEGGS